MPWKVSLIVSFLCGLMSLQDRCWAQDLRRIHCRTLTILQLGAGPEIVSALETGRIAAAALSTRYALPYLERGWPMLVDLSTTDLVYPSSCVKAAEALSKVNPNWLRIF
jgi:hypothetical protein